MNNISKEYTRYKVSHLPSAQAFTISRLLTQLNSLFFHWIESVVLEVDRRVIAKGWPNWLFDNEFWQCHHEAKEILLERTWANEFNCKNTQGQVVREPIDRYQLLPCTINENLESVTGLYLGKYLPNLIRTLCERLFQPCRRWTQWMCNFFILFFSQL